MADKSPKKEKPKKKKKTEAVVNSSTSFKEALPQPALVKKKKKGE